MGSREQSMVAFPLPLVMRGVTPVTFPNNGVRWWTVDGGGGTLTSGSYSLSGAVGQADAGAALDSNGYMLVGGYWYGAGEEVER